MEESENKLEELLDIVKSYKEEDYQKVIAERKDYTIMYHLSMARANLVSWLPIKKHQRVLEVNAECGACTGALARLAGEVTALERTEAEYTINKIRHAAQGNITYLLGGVVSLEKKEKASYDWIILTADKLPLLEELMPYLAPNGRLVIAASNCFGIRRWAGAPEETHDISLKELTGRLAAVGITELEYYYPYPDYEFPMMVYSDEFLPRTGELRHNRRNFKEARYEYFSERKAFDKVIKKNMFREYANAYLILTGRGTDKEKLIYAKYSDERARRFMVRTDIIKKQTGESYVRKQAIVPGDKAHLQYIENCCACLKKRYAGSILQINTCSRKDTSGELVFEYLEGVSLSDIIKTKADAKEAAAMQKLLDCYRELVTWGCKLQPFEMSEGFRHVFGDIKLPEHTLAAAGLDIDMIFSNIIVQKEAWQLIDYEWTFDFPIPVNYILYRAYLYESLEHPENEMVSIPALKQMGILSEEEEAAYRKMELGFLAYTLQGIIPTRDMQQLIGNPVWDLPYLESEVERLTKEWQHTLKDLLRCDAELSAIKASRTWKLHERLRRRKE